MRILIIFSFLLLTTRISAKNWDQVVFAIAKIESNHNVSAVNGKYVGYLQIAPIIVEDCNRILKKRNISKRFKLSDRYNKTKSIEMFILYQSFYNPKGSVERAIRLWNGGPNYSYSATQRYYQRVMYHYRKQ